MRKKKKSHARERQAARAVIVLAAGLGKRMRSSLPKVLHEVGGRPLLFHVLGEIHRVFPDAEIALVVGHGREMIQKAVHETAPFSRQKITFIHQAEQRGTGHAARCAMDSVWGEARVSERASVLVLPGDLPLVTAELIRRVHEPLGSGESFRLLSCEMPDPTGYGRVIRKNPKGRTGKPGAIQRIVEERDADARAKRIREVATSIYSFDSAFLQSALRKLSSDNSQGEFYLTDVIEQAAKGRKKSSSLLWPDAQELRGVNDPWELAQAGRILNERTLRNWATARGVKFVDPWNTRVDVTVELDEGVVVGPGACLSGSTRVEKGATLGPNVVLHDVRVGPGARVMAGTVAHQAEIGAEAQVGPYAHLRPESVVGARAKIGNFVELKKTRIGEHTSVAHLSYLGDAEVGRNVNIGCGFVTCNFDGRIIDGQRKHRTIIEDEVFLGSDCQAVAPVRIGRGAYIASGSTITEDVEAEALAIARSRQVTKPGYARRLRQRG